MELVLQHSSPPDPTEPGALVNVVQCWKKIDKHVYPEEGERRGRLPGSRSYEDSSIRVSDQVSRKSRRYTPREDEVEDFFLDIFYYLGYF